MFHILVIFFYCTYALSLETSDMQNRISFGSQTINDDALYNRSSIYTGVPVFDQVTYKIEISENIPVGTSITTVRATERNTAHIQNIGYSIIAPVNQNTFRIDPTLGGIFTLKVLDREVQSEYQLVIQARDLDNLRKQQSSTAIVHITVLDVNDNAPRFAQEFFDAKVYENSPISTLVYRLYATDFDIGKNQEIRYSIIDGNSDGAFDINSTSGEVFTNVVLNYEVKHYYTLRVKASDPFLSTTTTLNVTVLDINDNIPRLEQKYAALVRENVTFGYMILAITADDYDSGNNARVTYSIEPKAIASDLPFKIDANTGIMFVSGHLDSDTKNRYVFKVNATDHGMPPLSSATTVDIRVLDANDNKPMFIDKEILVNVSVNTVVGKRITKVNALDPDFYDFLTYRIMNGNNDQFFKIQNETGVLTLKKSLLFTNIHNFNITVQVSDGIYFDTACVIILLTGTLSQTLSFQEDSYQFSVFEDQAIGTVIGKVEIANKSSAVTYKLLNTNAFSIDKITGVIITKETFDRESKFMYRFAVEANTIDHRYQGTVNIIVSVEDINDNPPVFSKSEYVTSIRKPVTAGEVVITVHAIDSDIGINSDIRYSLIASNNESNDYSIERTSGVIFVSQSNLINKEPAGNYSLIVQAVDRGIVPLSSQVMVKIKVEEEVIPVG